MSGLDTSMTLLPYFAKKTQLSSFLHYLNSRHDNIQFTIEFENDQQIPFLDVSLMMPWQQLLLNIHLPQEDFHWTLY